METLLAYTAFVTTPRQSCLPKGWVMREIQDSLVPELAQPEKADSTAPLGQGSAAVNTGERGGGSHPTGAHW